jgi:hypothetical protein
MEKEYRKEPSPNEWKENGQKLGDMALLRDILLQVRNGMV